MAATDPIADGLTKLRNASLAKHPTVDLRASRVVERILDVLKQEGMIRTYKPIGQEPSQRALRVYLKYVKKTPVISQVIRVSKPGVRRYRKAAELPRVLNGLGLAIISTSKGLMTDREAYRQRIGGEVMCYVW
jgi:small subunit ribosomal protein S8